MVSPFRIRKAALAIAQGGTIAYPTEAVYGLGCDPYQETAVLHLLALKRRPIEKGLILVASQLDQLADFIDPLSEQQRQTILQHRNTTWVVPAKDAPFYLSGQHNSLAIRLSAHPVVMQLCEQLKQPITSTSANPSDKPAAKNSLTTHQYFHSELDIIINANTGSLEQPTEIRDLLTHEVIRAN